MFADAFDEGTIGGNPDGVVVRGISADHAAEREQTGGAAEGGVLIAFHFNLKTRRAGGLLAEDELFSGLRGVFFAPGAAIDKKPLQLPSFPENENPPSLSVATAGREEFEFESASLPSNRPN